METGLPVQALSSHHMGDVYFSSCTAVDYFEHCYVWIVFCLTLNTSFSQNV